MKKKKEKQHLIDIMKSDEELGLYKEPKQECMITKNSYPSSEFESKDRCPSCGNFCNIHIDLNDNDECNDCRDNIDTLEIGQIIPKEKSKLETLEEVARVSFELGYDKGAKWQKERSYSKEEVEDIAWSAWYESQFQKPENRDEEGFDRWFEQYKKK